MDGCRAILAARLLYVARPGEALEAPGLGMPDVTLNEDSRLCPHCPLVVCCEIPFLPVGAWALWGAPTSAARFVERAAPLGRMHERPLTPTGSPVEAADRIVVPEVWRGVDLATAWAATSMRSGDASPATPETRRLRWDARAGRFAVREPGRPTAG